MLMYGGKLTDRGGWYVWLTDLWVFGLETEQWTELRQEGAGPGKRYEHIMLSRGSDTFVGFGLNGAK